MAGRRPRSKGDYRLAGPCGPRRSNIRHACSFGGHHSARPLHRRRGLTGTPWAPRRFSLARAARRVLPSRCCPSGWCAMRRILAGSRTRFQGRSQRRWIAHFSVGLQIQALGSSAILGDLDYSALCVCSPANRNSGLLYGRQEHLSCQTQQEPSRGLVGGPAGDSARQTRPSSISEAEIAVASHSPCQLVTQHGDPAGAPAGDAAGTLVFRLSAASEGKLKCASVSLSVQLSP